MGAKWHVKFSGTRHSAKYKYSAGRVQIYLFIAAQAWRSIDRSILSSMQLPPVIETILLNVITPECYQSLIVEHHVFSDIACVQMVISKVLGYAIILGSVILKLPQILKICAAKDVTGLSLTSFYLDVLIFESNTVYNYLMGYPISTWGENIVILIQNLVLVLLIWSYTSTHVVSSITRVSFTLIFVLIGQAMLYIPHEYRWMLIVSGIPLSVAARVPQVSTIQCILSCVPSSLMKILRPRLFKMLNSNIPVSLRS